MKLIILAGLLAASSAAKLGTNYLPPNSAKTAGGSGSFLNAPFGSATSSRGSFSHSGSAFQTSSSSTGAKFSGAKSAEAGAAILRFNNNNNGDGSYQFDFQTENKISQNEAGQLKNAGSDSEAEEVQGSYSYTAPDGQVITVTYIANEFGFQPVGDHLPTPPPIPEAILKSLQLTSGGSQTGGFSSSSSNNGQFRASSLNNQYLAPAANSQSQSGYRY